MSSFTSFTHLKVSGISKSFPDRRVFTNISFSVAHHERVGIIGENGSGKTTLLSILAGELPSDAGTVELFAPQGEDLHIGLLHQQPQFPGSLTVAEVLERSIARLRTAEAQVADAAAAIATTPEASGAMHDYMAALDVAERLGAWGIEAHLETTMHGLGLDELARDKTVDQLSGGQRARLAMASLLLSSPDILLLDEPTNHLDDSALQYLTTVIADWHGPVILVSHDRAFLDETVVSILDLDPAPRQIAAQTHHDVLPSIGVTRFSGTYSDYVRYQREARQRWQHQFDQEQAEIKRLRAAVHEQQVVGHSDWKPRTESRIAKKFYADRNAKVVARRVNDARSRLAEAEQHQIVKPPEPLIFQGLDAATEDSETTIPVDDALIRAQNIRVARRLDPVSLNLSQGEHLLITGANGTGKSTLLEVLSGALTPTGGTLECAADVTYRMLRQESSWDEVADQTARAVYEQTVGFERAQVVPLSTFGLLSPRDENRPIATLSVGQQRRLDLAVLLANPPEVLLLDEPTNHLSLVLVTELEASMEHYPGTVIVASHDRWLRERWQGKRLHLQ